MEFSEYINKNLKYRLDDSKINQAIEGITYCIGRDIPIIVIGNGGSAYNASHFVQDLVKSTGALAFSLTDNSGLITAIANDIDYNSVFSYQLPRFGKRMLLICISYSGNSENILFAAKRSKHLDIPVLSFTGNTGGELSKLSSLEIRVPSDDICYVESMHSMILHFIVRSVQENICRKILSY